MGSKPKTGTGVSQAEMPPIRLSEEKVRRTNRWLVGTVVVLALAVVALVVALVVESGNEAAPTPEAISASGTVLLPKPGPQEDPSEFALAARPAGPQEVELVDRFFGAYNRAVELGDGPPSLPAWGYDSAVRWTWDPWDWPGRGGQLSRYGPVVELYQPGFDEWIPDQGGDPEDFPHYLMFDVDESGGFTTWITVWRGHRILAIWVLGT